MSFEFCEGATSSALLKYRPSVASGRFVYVRFVHYQVSTNYKLYAFIFSQSFIFTICPYIIEQNLFQYAFNF